MACDLSSGRVVGCKSGIGGIVRVYIGNFQDLTAGAAWSETGGVVSATEVQDVYQFDVRPETSSLTINFQASPTNGTTFFEQNLSLVFQKLDSTDIADIRILCQGRPNIWVETQDRDSTGLIPVVYLLGAEFGLNVTAGSAQSGTAMGDLTGYNIELQGKEREVFYQAADGTVASPLSGVTGPAVTA
tara:strand:- start:100 stop:660 length:561 start_codon:yes stop_codon:yes gene_type:complete